MLGAFAEGTSRFTNFSTGADCASTLACMESLGAKVNRIGNEAVEITGVGGRVTPSASALDCGNSGSTMRMMSGLLAPQMGSFTLIGDASLSRRPMERVRKPLETMGAKLTLTDGHAPLSIVGTQLNPIDYTTPVPSAQVKTCILLAGLQTTGTTSVREAVRTRDHSELALRAFGATLTRTIDSISISGPQALHAIEAAVPGDFVVRCLFPLRRGALSRFQPVARVAGAQPDTRCVAGCIDGAGREDIRTPSRGKTCGAGWIGARLGTG